MALISNDFIIEPDIAIKYGDFNIQPSDDRNVQYITYASKGQFRKAPTLGVGITDFTNAPTTDGRNIRKAIRQELSKDGYRLSQLNSSIDTEGITEINIKADKVAIKV